MTAHFDGSSLRLARIFCGLALEEVADRVGKSRQYIHMLETKQSQPTEQLLIDLADALGVETNFFTSNNSQLNEDQFHFRKLTTTKNTLKQAVIARGELTHNLIKYLENELKLPEIKFPTISNIQTLQDIERAAERCRTEWQLGFGPISNMTRLAENLGSIVTTFQGLTKEIDALSVAVNRPFIVRNSAKESVCRQRFDIAHELGHLVMHEGIITGDRHTENQANRFASALLLPHSMMLKFFPRPSSRLDWIGMSEFKLTWKVSKAAILYRARQLDLINDAQYKSGFITLRKNGETHGEREDHLIAKESPEMLLRSFRVLAERKGIYPQDVAKSLNIKPHTLSELTGLPLHTIVSPPSQRQPYPSLRLVT